MKICNVCLKEKPLDQFWTLRNAKDGKQRRCIECSKARWEEKFTRNAEARAALREKDKQRWDADVQGYLYTTAKKRAKKQGIEFTIEKDDIKVVDKCPITGVAMSRYRGTLEHESYSLDRVDSTKGYVPGNVRVISWFANLAKSRLTLQEAENLCKYMRGEL